MTRHFSRETFAFLRDLQRNNTRAWFAANRARYEEHLKDPSLRLIEDLAPELERISPHFLATPRALFRIHRDTRFSKDKSPYKTYLGLQFRHRSGRDAHAPGFYFHVEPGSVFLGAGIWRPDAPALHRIREHIVAEPAAWKRASRAPSFTAVYSQDGDRLSRPPRGFDADHPLVEDLKWKDYIGTSEVDDKFAMSPDLVPELGRAFTAAKPFMRFLCDALDVPF